jgi:hypothetical protein
MSSVHLRKSAFLLLFLAAIPIGACQRKADASASAAPASEPAPPSTSPNSGASVATLGSLRKVVKKAALELVVASPARAQGEAMRIAERLGGFVATSAQVTELSPEDTTPRIELTLRVPSAEFGRALDALRALGRGDGTEQVGSEDVSEEFVDLEARILNQEKLEAQFHELLKRASKVEEALQVHREITNVRTEIDRMRGRRTFLERETALSTISVVFRADRPLVTASLDGFRRSMLSAYSDAVNLGATLVTVLIRATGVIVPLSVFFGLPVVLSMLYFRRRRAKRLTQGSVAA